MSKTVYFKTSNNEKAIEVARQFERYGVKVVTTKPAKSTKEYFAKITEHTELKGKYGKLQNLQLEPVIHASTLVYTVFKGGDKQVGSITKQVEGHLDFDRRVDGTFGFDSFFVITELGKSYHQLKLLGFKLSARDHCVSEFIKQFLYRTTLADWKHTPQHFEKPLELHRDPFLFFEKNVHVNNPVAVGYGIMNMIRYVLNRGLFFRACQNRRQGLYWFPGLNAGIPFTSKPKDPLHELVYFIHDMCHQAIPDLVYVGGDSRVIRFTYIAYRLMSEAVTLVCADMSFVHSLFQSGFNYETVDGRKIYPFFKSMNVDLSKPGELFNVMRDDMIFCLMGDPSGFEKRNPDPDKLKEFVGKYEKFFIQDFKWTAHNYEDMNSRGETYAKWWASVNSWQRNNKLLTVDDFVGLLGPEFSSIVEKDTRTACKLIFEKILELYIVPAFSQENKLEPIEVRYDNMFRRYMMGQAYIFFRFGFLDNSRYFEQLDRMMRREGLISPVQGESIRNFYNDYLLHLKSLSLITDDDFVTFKEIYPVFEPMILSYDTDLTESHKAFASRILEGDK